MAEIDVTYSIDGNSFASYGVYVSGSTGILGKPEAKDHLNAEWNGHNGTMRDLEHLKYSGESVELSCFIEADGYDDFQTKANNFLSVLEAQNLHTLVCQIGAQTITMSNMYYQKETKITKTWDPVKMVGTLTLKLDQSVPADQSRITTYPAPTYPTDGDVHYSVDGKDFQDYGVMVTASNGIFTKPNQKEPLTVDWDDLNGVQMDTDSPILFQERTIELTCTAYAATYTDFLTKMQSFVALFSGTGTHRFRIYAGSKPLVYEVYHPSQISVKPNSWHAKDMIGTFTLKLVEPEPVKIVLKMSGSASVTIASDTIAHIYWGDGSHTFNLSGDGSEETATHTFSGTYEVIITVETTGVTKLTHNGTVLWNRLV